jgi:hypothetical protein
MARPVGSKNRRLVPNRGANQLARELGVSRSSVDKWMTDGKTVEEIRIKVAMGKGGVRDAESGISGVRGWKAKRLAEGMRLGEIEKRTDETSKPGFAKPIRVVPVPVSVQVQAPVSFLNGVEPLDDDDGADRLTDAQIRVIAESKLEAELRKLQAQADDTELKVAKQKRDLVPVSDMNDWMSKCIIKARDRFLRIGQELGDRLAEETSAARCTQMVEDEVRLGLDELKEWVRPA